MDLVLIWAGIVAFAVLAYVALDGFDLGLGVLFFVTPREEERKLMLASIAPVWDGNATWLVMGGGGLFAAFPVAFAVVMSALYLHFRKGAPIETAMRQLSLRFGHMKQAKTGILDFFLATYVAYNAKTPVPFETWVREIYDRDAVTKAFRDSWWASVVTDRIMRRE